MKKLSLLGALLLVVFVAGCSWGGNKEKEAEAKAEINVESCNAYFELVNCIIDNDTDTSYSQEDRDMIRASVNDMRNDWASLDEDTLDELCTKEINKFDSMSDYLSQIGCALD